MKEYVYKKKIYKFLFSVIDIIGSIVFFPARLFGKPLPEKFDRILLVRGDHIGDIVASTVVLKPLKDAFPGAYVDFLVPSWGAEIIENDPHVDDVIEFHFPWFDRSRGGFAASIKGLRKMIKTIREGKYDLVIDLRGDARHIFSMFAAGVPVRISYGITGGGFLLTHEVPYTGKTHERQRNLNLLLPLGIKADARSPRFYLTDEDKSQADRLLAENAAGNDFALIHVVPGHSSKEWQNDKFANVIEHIFKKGLTPVLLGSKSDAAKVQVLRTPGVADLSGKTSIRELAAISAKAALFVGLDSGPAHIAALSDIPSVVLFSGVNDPDQWAPKGENVTVVFPGEGKDLSYVSSEEVCDIIDEILGPGVQGLDI